MVLRFKSCRRGSDPFSDTDHQNSKRQIVSTHAPAINGECMAVRQWELGIFPCCVAVMGLRWFRIRFNTHPKTDSLPQFLRAKTPSLINPGQVSRRDVPCRIRLPRPMSFLVLPHTVPENSAESQRGQSND